MANEVAIMEGENGALAEARLWQAVITTAIEEWVSGPLRKQRVAEQYLFNDDSDFRFVCQAAGMDPDFLRGEAFENPATNDDSGQLPACGVD